MLRLVLCLCVAWFTIPAFGKLPDYEKLPERVRGFLDLNCYECHNPVDKKGSLDLESMRFDPTDKANMKLWAFVHDRIRDEEMPPKEDSLIEPEERASFLTEFEPFLHGVSREYIADAGRVKSRRLNRIEYQNTIHDILGVEIPLLEIIPEDQA